MGKYTVITGQNLYDIALHIYGSIEGIVDLLMNNPDLSLCDNLKNGDILEYTDGLIINEDIIVYNRMNGIVPSNNERNVYPKFSSKPQLCEVQLKSERTFVEFNIHATCEIDIDWGDNSPMESITLSNKELRLYHAFDNQCKGNRIIRIYGNGLFKVIDWNSLNPLHIYPYKPIKSEKLYAQNFTTSLDFLILFDGLYEISLHKLKTDNLLPLIYQTKLKELDLTDAKISRIIIDEYLIGLVNNYENRRNCHIIFSTEPTGEFKEPSRDADNKYILRSGMEAVWVILNEPAWNEAGKWIFTIKDQIYTYNK
ncbi:hypothetical protein [Bacteroides sp.]|uniref:hypothetical protein n=1 Tax=Bacteroides sp. TaxID=29523 RepID=UPI0025C5A173|nr:hypothetical protein [Bacteroides sp.]